ncbi:MAG: glutamate synthase-related protein [Calditrichia bacterium]
MDKVTIQSGLEFLKDSSAAKRVASQQNAIELLLENYKRTDVNEQLSGDAAYKELRSKLSEATAIFTLTAVQKEIYHSDSGTAVVPTFLKNRLLNLHCRFVVRPGTLEDLQLFVAYAHSEKIRYTVRGSGSWPFGGSIPMNNEIVVDLSYLDFHQLDTESATLTIGAGAVFSKMRTALKKDGYALKQEITNPHSGTICGWIVTGGLGLGTYKYGPVKESVKKLFLLTPFGEWKTLTPSDDLFDDIFDSEGQIGIIAGAEISVKKMSFVSKPYAFSFEHSREAAAFIEQIEEWKLSPTSILYFDKNYITTTYQIQKEKHQHELEKALASEDDLRIARERQQMETVARLQNLNHVVAMEFDTQEDYEQTLKYHFFNSREDKSRYRDISFQRQPVDVAHKFWDHRFAPVEMKSKGPSMLVSECVLPFDKFAEYCDFIQSAITNWTNNPVKTEAHVLPGGKLLIQSILLADIGTRRHKIYLGLVPFMMQTAISFGGRPYGTGIWNLPFLKGLRANGYEEKINKLTELKKELDPNGLVNQCKYVHPTGRKVALRLFSGTTPLINIGVRFLRRGWKKDSGFSIYSLGRMLWRANRAIFPSVIPPNIEVERHPIMEINDSCAECDSCEKVCPTSDVFGMWGLATPITRRKTANRLAKGEQIDQEEALGFLVCTRCDNCTRVCPSDLPLTDMFDMVEGDKAFQDALGLSLDQKNDFVDRMWDIMKESPLYVEHTKAEQKEDKSHLQHGLEINYKRGYAYAKLFIDEETCINCGMCAHENACIYGARAGNPREMPELIDENCALCNACINFCPQNKAVQMERDYIQDLITNAVDMDEQQYWEEKKGFLRDTTTIQPSPEVKAKSDVYVTEVILTEIDKEASTGQIPVSGMGQGDRHMGIGFDAERFSHFHIVGPAQNRLHEGDPDEELSVILGKRHRYCKFDEKERLDFDPFPNIKLMSPMLYNSVRLHSNGRAELAFIKVAEIQSTLAVIKLNRLLENYDFFLEEGKYDRLPPVVVPRVDHEMIDHLRVNPNIRREMLMDLWRMPMFEITPHKEMESTVQFIRESAKSLHDKSPLICGYLEVSEYDIVGGEILPKLKKRLEALMALDIDVLHVHGLRNKDQYFVTSEAVRTIHHYLLSSGRRHGISLVASGGIRLASDSQKTIQRGAEATLLDFAALLALDPNAYRATLQDKTTTDKLINLDIDIAVERLNNQIESRKVQILEVLGASGFKDIKKTVGEEGRLIDFYELEERVQKDIFEHEEKVTVHEKLNIDLLKKEPLPPKSSPSYTELRERLTDLRSPHHFYNLSDENKTVYQRDHVWPGDLIQTVGKMAAGDPEMGYLKNVKATGLLGDGFDVMKILYQQDPDNIPEEELNHISTALPLDKDLVLSAPWMFGGKSVGSIGLDTWRSHVIASRELGIQYDSGEGGYPTSFFLNRKGEPIFFDEPEMKLIKKHFEHDTQHTCQEIRDILSKNGMTKDKYPRIFEVLEAYPDSQPFLYYEVIGEADEPFVSTEMKTGLFGVTKETIKKARRVVIAYSQGAKMGIGGHILAGKVNKLVSYLRGIQGMEELNTDRVKSLIERIERIEASADHPLKGETKEIFSELKRAHDDEEVYPELKTLLWKIQQKTYELNEEGKLDQLDFESILRMCEEVISFSYSSVISPFPFHNCYSIEDVKSFIDMVRMINPGAVVSVKVSPSVDIEFIAAGLARISRDNTNEVLKRKVKEVESNTLQLSDELAEYARKYGMQIEIWLDGPRGGTGASPNIIKGQMGMHIEYAIPLIHDRLVRDGLRNSVKFIVSGGIRTYEDVIKAVALGADGVIWGTAPLVAIGCDRNRNCHDGCSRGIATSNLIMQNLRNVDLNSKQMINAFLVMQMQVIRALAGLGLKDIRELRGRFDKVQWIGLKERVDFRIRQRREHSKHTRDMMKPAAELEHQTGQTNCGVAAVIGTHNVPSYILDEALYAMKNRGMDGVGVGKTLCFPEFPHHYAYRVMVKGKLQLEMEEHLRKNNGTIKSEDAYRKKARKNLLEYRYELAQKIRNIFLEPFFEFSGETDVRKVREPYKEKNNVERDYREFGNPNTDPGDIFRFFVRVKEDVLIEFIENELLSAPRFAYVREFFSDIDRTNYRESGRFMQKAEDFFVFNHSVMLTQVLYVWDLQSDDWSEHAAKNDAFREYLPILLQDDPFAGNGMGSHVDGYLQLLKSFIAEYPFSDFKHKYTARTRKIAAVMSCGKNFAIWKTAGREIPWETPASPNNIIHVRLATGSVVEQMNAHPFGKLHTALTHNGETTNYETLKQRVEQFGLPPLASTDTEVASLKFHLVAEELEYPDWALFESLSPTTGDDLALMPEEMRSELEGVQRVEFTSSPDGPYQYLCLRHNPNDGATERIDLKDPADLRPGTTSFWYDNNGKDKRAYSIIASEEQASQRVLELLDKEGLIDGAMPDLVTVSNGMINRFEYDESGKIYDYKLFDRYGNSIDLPDSGEHYSFKRNKVKKPKNAADLLKLINELSVSELKTHIRENVAKWDFNSYRWMMHQLVEQGLAKKGSKSSNECIELMTWCIDILRTIDTGKMATSSLVDITQNVLDAFFDSLAESHSDIWVKRTFENSDVPKVGDADKQILLLDATGFEPEGIDPELCLAALLTKAYDLGWRKYVLYRVNGQRLISTAVMGSSDTEDVVIDVYGMPGEYFGAFMQGGTIRCHGNAQNFCAMGIHHGNLTVYGNAGKVCGYASKGGKIVILGDIVDRAWTNSVNDPRCQDLEIHILGSASKYAGESLMGGDFFFGGMYFDQNGQLRTQDRPYRGTKMMGGASRGRMLFFNPKDSLHENQYTHGKIEEISDEDWGYWKDTVESTLETAGVSLTKKGEVTSFVADETEFEIDRKNFTLIIPKGGLKGYESH